MLDVTVRRAAVSLSPRELEVVDLVRRGLTAKEIGGQLGISIWTVRGHIDSAKLRFGAKNLPELIDFLARPRAARAREPCRTS